MVDNAIHCMDKSHYPVDNTIGFPNTSPLDSDSVIRWIALFSLWTTGAEVYMRASSNSRLFVNIWLKLAHVLRTLYCSRMWFPDKRIWKTLPWKAKMWYASIKNALRVLNENCALWARDSQADWLLPRYVYCKYAISLVYDSGPFAAGYSLCTKPPCRRTRDAMEQTNKKLLY